VAHGRRVGSASIEEQARETAGSEADPSHGAPERGVECAQVMASAEKNIEVRAIASSLDERDRAILHALLEHKVLTTHQLRVLFFRSLRRCQHRLRELKDLEIISSFPPPQEFGKGRLPDHHFLTSLGRSVVAHLDGIPRDDLPWIPDEGYGDNRNLRHRMGVNAFFCSLAEASLRHEGHCLERWRPERRVRTRAGEIQPDGFGRYLHPGGACEFYLEYDRATEGITALSEKLRGYLRVSGGWGEGAQFPNVLVLVPTERREGEVVRAWTQAAHPGRKPSTVPVFVTNEDLLGVLGVLGPVWLPAGQGQDRPCLTGLPATDAGPYELGRCLGQYWTEDGAWPRISPFSWAARFPPGEPRERG
jgi:Replication-relaxation